MGLSLSSLTIWKVGGSRRSQQKPLGSREHLQGREPSQVRCLVIFFWYYLSDHLLPVAPTSVLLKSG